MLHLNDVVVRDDDADDDYIAKYVWLFLKYSSVCVFNDAIDNPCKCLHVKVYF